MASKRKATRPKATAWDKISARDTGETMSNRDVHGHQQLDRGERARIRSERPGQVLGLIVGVVTGVAAWILYSLLAVMVLTVGTALGGLGSGTGTQNYYTEQTTSGEGGKVVTCYQALDQDGQPDGKCYKDTDDVPVPDWYKAQEKDKGSSKESTEGPSLGDQLASASLMKIFVCVGTGLLAGVASGAVLIKRVRRENAIADTSDINQYENDQHIALPEEIMRKFDYFPDAGGHSAVEASSMLSHVMLKTKGLKKVEVTKRAEKDIIDEDGDVVYYKGEAMVDDDGEELTASMPIIDEKFGDDLFEASGLPADKSLRKKFDTTVVPYKPEASDRDKLGSYKKVSDLINDDWDFPSYEVQRPGGAYLVDTAPVNTMVLAITRAGKGQTYIEPVLDIWSREKNPSNMVINDPKGELLVKNYIPFVVRGFQPVQFNLINSMKTDIYNPLGLAAESAREGDGTKMAMYVENIAEVFFPTDGGEDPVWPNAANNAFKRAAYGLIDFYLEEERELREHAAKTGMDPATLEQKLDDMWGKVTLYNCYQLFVQLTSKKVKNPEAELKKKADAGEFDEDPDGLEAAQQEAEAQSFLWEGQAEQDMLTLYFNATEALPENSMRKYVANANNALRSMGSAEKMLASVYGIAITAMSFFTDPTISTLTSGKPSQNTDLAGLSFPRRLGVRFAQNYLKRENLLGQQAVWSAYADPMFTENLGKDFEHEEIVGREGWARYNFKGIFPTDEAWLKLELVNPQSKMLLRTFYFHFEKGYQLSLNGRHYVVEPVTGKKIVKDGVLRELRPEREGGTADGKILKYRIASTTFPQDRLDLGASGAPEKIRDDARAIIRTMVRYSEQPKAVFLVTPPHLMKYAKLVLILVKQLVDVSFDQSYMTKSNQKPLYRTRFMLDELGNLQSEGHGIAGFETMLSIGLGQEQQFTLILQTLQQLRDVYGESVDKIVQGNVSNIIFLKSTDDAMIEQLEKMSGKTHKTYSTGKTISQDVDKLVGGMTDARVSKNIQTEEKPVISYNDMAFISERNSIIFRAGDAPIWNRNETILPMSWRLFKDKIVHPGHEYSLQTIPTLSSAMEFDVRRNQPDFKKMLDKRMKQAVKAADAKQLYRSSYKYEDVDIERLDPDVYSDEVMQIVQMMANVDEGRDPHAAPEVDTDDLQASMIFDDDSVAENIEVATEVAAREQKAADAARKIYAEGRISKDMLVNPDGSAKLKALDLEIGEAYKAAMAQIQRDTQHFSVGADDELRSADGSKTYITPQRSDSYLRAARDLGDASGDAGSRVYAEGEVSDEDLRQLTSMEVHAEFYQFLASLSSWEILAGGEFERAMGVEMSRGD